MNVLAIDPGPIESAFVLLDGDGRTLKKFGKVLNAELRVIINHPRLHGIDLVVIEMIASYGMAVGATVFDTCVEIGRLMQLADINNLPCYRLKRKEICLHMCGTPRAKDSNIRQRCLDMYPATGGGKTPQVGIKSKKGPLFGVSADVWAALAVGLTYLGEQ